MNQASARCIFRRNGMPRSRLGIRGVTPEGQIAGVRREARRDWKITEMPPVNAQSLGLVALGFLRVDSINRNQILSEIRSRSGPDRCIWHANRDKSNQLSNQSNVLSINQSHHGTISKNVNPSIHQANQVSFKHSKHHILNTITPLPTPLTHLNLT